MRLRQHGEDAVRIAKFLNDHPAVGKVHYPLFDPDPDLVARQLTGMSGLLSFELAKADFESVSRVIDALEHPRIGVSWGGVARRGIPRGLIRLSVGLEGANLLIDDLAAALAAVS